MSGFEHYDRELQDLDSEIHRYAAVCGVNIANRHEVEACLRNHHEGWAADKARESLEGLLILRIKLETEMISLGFSPPPLVPPSSGL
ncbi:hypothetical protein [Dechloromonas sp. HYN0024]|uniref:hypothetical protein n=1 Tax=Dechloromonas sp. HYN0024 TaxID=2231055 RepID=UPI000E44F350|nr:hypothetical protein [Dechloromonas sp. HYN0024]AXS81202.1 hypothetical protein HYN24_14875 [Dechloromonas sp. HYN0024]